MQMLAFLTSLPRDRRRREDRHRLPTRTAAARLLLAFVMIAGIVGSLQAAAGKDAANRAASFVPQGDRP